MDIFKHCKAQQYVVFHEAKRRAVQLCSGEFQVLPLADCKTLTQKLLVYCWLIQVCVHCLSNVIVGLWLKPWVSQLQINCGFSSFERGVSLGSWSQFMHSALSHQISGNVTSFLPLLRFFFFFLFYKKMRHKDRSRTCPKKVIMLSSTPSSSPPYPRQQVTPSACSVPFSSLLLVQVTGSLTK